VTAITTSQPSECKQSLTFHVWQLCHCSVCIHVCCNSNETNAQIWQWFQGAQLESTPEGPNIPQSYTENTGNSVGMQCGTDRCQCSLHFALLCLLWNVTSTNASENATENYQVDHDDTSVKSVYNKNSSWHLRLNKTYVLITIGHYQHDSRLPKPVSPHALTPSSLVSPYLPLSGLNQEINTKNKEVLGKNVSRSCLRRAASIGAVDHSHYLWVSNAVFQLYVGQFVLLLNEPTLV